MLYDTFLVIDVLLLTLSIVSIMLLRFDKYSLSATCRFKRGVLRHNDIYI